MIDTDELIRRLAMLLDCCMDDLARKAEAERLREAGKSMRQVTCQERHKAALELLAEAEAYLSGDAA